MFYIASIADNNMDIVANELTDVNYEYKYGLEIEKRL